MFFYSLGFLAPLTWNVRAKTGAALAASWAEPRSASSALLAFPCPRNRTSRKVKSSIPPRAFIKKTRSLGRLNQRPTQRRFLSFKKKSLCHPPLSRGLLKTKRVRRITLFLERVVH